MALRSVRERILQTCAFELGGLCIAAPLYSLVFGATADAAVLLIATVAVAVLIWSPLHNTGFDLVEWRLTGRVASDRPHGLRVVQAMSLEATSIALTLPLVMAVGGHGLWDGLALDAGLTALYVVYGYGFHLGFDRLRPVRPGARAGFAARPVRRRLPRTCGTG